MDYSLASSARRACALLLLSIASSFASAATNPDRPPVFSGFPITKAQVGKVYSFQPNARDPEGKTLTFSIRNRPAWALFNPTTGRLAGTPKASGRTPSIMIIASDGVTSTAVQFIIDISAAANSKPTISGSPATIAHTGAAYRFIPSASDADRDALTFTVLNKPSWARFNSATGELSGTPSATGTTNNILILVNDGKNFSALGAFSLTVIPATVSAVVLGWTPPTAYTDGSPLTNLAGYRIWYGASPGNLSSSITINNPGIARHVIDGLRAGVWYFTVTAFTRDGAESDNSGVVSANVR